MLDPVTYVNRFNIKQKTMNASPGRSLLPSKSGLLAVATAVLITGTLTLALHARVAGQDGPQDKIPLTVEAISYSQQHSYQREVSYLGLVVAGRKANLGFELPGRIATLPWHEGSPVAKGQVIATLDDATLRAQYNVTQAQLEQSRTELELAQLNAKRQKDLRATGAVSREAFDETRLGAQALASQVEAVTAQLQSLEINISKARLLAPYDGVIADRFVHEGSVVSPSAPVVRFIESAGREARIGVSVSRTKSLKPGTYYPLTLRGSSFKAELLTLRPDVDPITRTTTAVFAIPEGIEAVDGEPLTLQLEESVNATGGWLPIAALLEGSRGVWNVLQLNKKGGYYTTSREAVEVIDIRNDQAYVRGTLINGSLVVASGLHRITPETPVQVQP